MKLKMTIELDIDESYGQSEEEQLWLESEVLVGDGSLFLFSNEIGDEVGMIRKVTNIQWIKTNEDAKTV